VGGRFASGVIVITAFAVVLSGLIALVALWPESGDRADLNAVIVDQLATTDPNPAFVADVMTELELAGYHVDYVSAENVTVDFYRDLGAHQYELVILRSHSSGSLRINVTREGSGPPETSTSTLDAVQLFTNEPYSTAEHVSNQLALDLSRVRYEAGRDENAYFGITARFVATVMRGSFRGSVVLLMGCDGLSSNDLATAFIDRGADSFVGWSGRVTARHTDSVALSLLRHIARDGMDVEQAVAAANEEHGPDEAFNSSLEIRRSR
jgi:hypothetical protein